MTAAPDRYAVVIPAYNEAATIADIAERARALLAQVIVVDDGSNDGTAEQLHGLDVTVLRNDVNCGKAVSLWRGMELALAEGATAVITLDADGQHRPEDIPRLLAAVEQHPGQLIVASRLRRAVAPPPLRLFANRCANFGISWAAGYRIADSQSGFRLYPASLLRHLPAPYGRGSGFVFESETLIEAAWQGVRSYPVVIDSIYPAAARPSHYRPVVDTLRIMRMVALRLLRRGLYPLGLWRMLASRRRSRCRMLARTDQLALGYAATVAASVGLFGFSVLTLGLPTLLLAGLLTDGIARPASGVLYPTLVHGPRSGNRVALSFDDGPDPAVTPGVLEVLARHGAHASFFVIGRKLEQFPDLARRIHAAGHELGNHSWRHSRWQNFWGVAAQAEEIRRGEQSIAAVTGDVARPLYRPPIGLKSPPLAQAARRLGLTLCAWSLHARDTRGATPEQVAARVLSRVRAGDIILMHDGHDLPGRTRPACPEAAALILAGLREKGLESVTVSELLGLSVVPREAGYASASRSQAR